MTRVTQMGGVEAQGQQQVQQQGQEPGQALQKKGTAPKIARQGDDGAEQQGRKPTIFTDWASI